MLLLVIIVLSGLSVSFICSVQEATLLSTTIGELTDRAQAGDKGAAVLLDLKQNRLEYSISAILTLNTIAHTIGAALSGAQAASVFGDQWVGAFSAVLTVLILVATEIIPKTLGTVYGSRLAGIVGRSIKFEITVLYPILWVVHFLTRLVARGEKNPISKGEILAMVQMATDEGTLEGSESRVLTNVLRFDDVTVDDIMTPRTVVQMLPSEATLADLIEREPRSTASRIPLYEQTRDGVVGYILAREALRAAARGEDPTTPLSTFRRDVWFMPETVSISDALRQFLNRREHLAIVVDEHGGVSGLVTLEDIVETVLGAEILDEFDAVADLRKYAIEVRDRRLKRLQQRAQPASDEAASNS